MGKKGVKNVPLVLLVFALLSVSCVPQASSAKLAKDWSQTYGGSGDDVAHSLVFTDNGGIIIAGHTRSFGEGKLNNFHLVKANNNGYVQWRRTYGGAYDDEPEEIIKTGDGGYAVAGSSESFKGKAQYDFYIIKTDSKGRKEWDTGFGGRYNEKCYSVIQTEDNGFLMAGSTITYGARGNDFWAVKTDGDGNIKWVKAYGGDGDDICRSVIETHDGNYLLAGYTDSFGDPGQGGYLVKIDGSGDVIWNRTAGGTFDDYVYDITKTEDGGYAYVGSTTSYGAGEESFWLVKTNSTGHEQWHYASDGDYDEVAYSVTTNKKGNYMMAGYTSSYGHGGKDVWVVEVDKKGEAVSKETFGSDRDEEAFSIAMSSGGRYAVAGYTNSFGAGGEDFWVVKLGTPKKIPIFWTGAGLAIFVAGVAVFHKLNQKYRFI